jgi:methylglutaconyl-CoA hydratase
MLQIEVSEDIAWVTLDRPEVHNAFNPALVARLTTAFDDLGQRPDVRVVVLAGNGKSFCAGGDIRWMQKTIDCTEDENLADARKMAAMFRAIARCPRPVIARVHGPALGGGAGLVAVADIAIASETAVFGFTEVRLGIVPGVISPYLVSRIGVGRAREYCLTSETFPARTAESIGLVHAVASDTAELDRIVRAKTAEVLMAGPGALAETKALITEVSALPMDAAADYGARALARARSGEEGQAGLKAFLGRRQPPWVKT